MNAARVQGNSLRPGETQTRQGPFARVGSFGLVAFGVLCAAVIASTFAAGSVVLVVGLTGSVGWAALAGVASLLLLAGLLSRIRHSPPERSGPAQVVLDRSRSPMRRFLVVLVVATGLSLFWAVPSPAPAAVDGPDGQVQGVTDLPLPDGTHLAVHLSRAEHPTAPPLIIVHGGPGVADMTDDVPAFAPLATHRDVYVYDRIGTGASSRLDDPTGYTTERDVSDLEALRASIGADRVVLHGHSWGARIVTAYAQEHPNRVAALVLSAPGDLPLGGDRLIGDLQTRLDRSSRPTSTCTSPVPATSSPTP